MGLTSTNRVAAPMGSSMQLLEAPVKTICLDIACGSAKANGWVGIDIAPIQGVDIVHDLLAFPWPIPDNSVREARCFHFVEHIPALCWCCRNQQDPLFAFMDELYRIMVPSGTVLIESPHSSSIRAWQDPTHRRGINEDTFAYADKSWREEKDVAHYDIHCNFSRVYNFITDDHGQIKDVRILLTKVPEK